MKKMEALLLVTLCSLMITGGQVLLKYALQGSNGLWKENVGLITNLTQWALNPYLIIGFIVYAIATFFFIYLLGRYELSYFYPLTASTYVFAYLAGIYLFQEQATLSKIAGVLVIILGIIIVSI
jgi:multidrug transporter EmrE-like cation transporter